MTTAAAALALALAAVVGCAESGPKVGPPVEWCDGSAPTPAELAACLDAVYGRGGSGSS